MINRSLIQSQISVYNTFFHIQIWISSILTKFNNKIISFSKNNSTYSVIGTIRLKWACKWPIYLNGTTYDIDNSISYFNTNEMIATYLFRNKFTKFSILKIQLYCYIIMFPFENLQTLKYKYIWIICKILNSQNINVRT